jgi:hypothetical protein
VNKPASFIASAIIACLLLQSVAAQSIGVVQAGASPVKVTIYKGRVRFVVADAEGLRLELFDLLGSPVFDSGTVAGNSFDWLTLNQEGRAVESSLYAYRLTLKSKAGADRQSYQGNLILDRKQQNLPDDFSAEVDRENRGEVRPQTAGIYDINATGNSYNINAQRMGIGTATPQSRLQVGAGGAAPLTVGSTLLVEEGVASSAVLKSTSGGEMLLFQDNAVGAIGTVSNHPLSLRTNNQNRIFIDASGRVGIGTNTPTATLTVNGIIEAAGGTLTGAILNASGQFNLNGARVLSINGIDNLFVGTETGNTNTGHSNSFVGKYAGFANTNGYENSFFGRRAGSGNTSGFKNSFFGEGSGYSNTTGSENSFFGKSAGSGNTTGSFNSFFGVRAGYENYLGNDNSFFGGRAGRANRFGNDNSFFGKDAGYHNIEGSHNSFFGKESGYYSEYSSDNSFFGGRAGYMNYYGNDNSFFGKEAGYRNEYGSYNSFFGKRAGYSNDRGGVNSFFGMNAGYANTTGSYNSFFGAQAGYANTTGSNNAFYGAGAGTSNTSALGNAFFGASAGTSNSTGETNAFFGYVAGLANTTGNGNTFVGRAAGSINTTGSRNTLIGENANLSAGTISNASAIGANAQVSQSNAVVLGSIIGINGATADTRVGIGVTAPVHKLQVVDARNTGLRVQNNIPGGTIASFGRFGDFRIDADFAPGGRLIVTEAGNVGIGTSTPGTRLQVVGNVSISGNLSKGGGSFKIDHPLDPANKYLYHSFVESPDMMNIYNGNVVTDKRGLAMVTLPDYFEALNRDFRYQLTVIGQFAQAIIVREVRDRRFTIKTSAPNVKVSWQVTGIRQDAFANQHRIPVEEIKQGNERGTYLYPEAFDKSSSTVAEQTSRPSRQRKPAKR